MKRWKLSDKRVLLILLGVLTAVIIGFDSNVSDMKIEMLTVQENTVNVRLTRPIANISLKYGTLKQFFLNY
ncbi:hypothetical protein N6H18_08995 [Reichenbachiella agarivorans]|uniref:Uncharacterized protein n=1 Tax=Reichenbachiella agarivorans TaxID=2979464 RepID=A0ABY6CVX2_9BACT|nr:hypothetical protein [Reichenbachiella agarivorans]UXP34079.1 hypothetical protein N6H18_08995 [Reichenbachiella agarivorans]